MIRTDSSYGFQQNPFIQKEFGREDTDQNAKHNRGSENVYSLANVYETADVCVRVYSQRMTAKVGCLPSEFISVNHSQAAD